MIHPIAYITNKFRAVLSPVRVRWEKVKYPPTAHPEDFSPMPTKTKEAFDVFMKMADNLSAAELAHYDTVETDAITNHYDAWLESDEAAHRVFCVAYESGRLSPNPTLSAWRHANALDLAADHLCTQPSGGGSYLVVAIACMDLIDPTDLALVAWTWMAASLPLPDAIAELIGSLR